MKLSDREICQFNFSYSFPFLGNSVLSTENDINTQLAKPETAIDRLLVICKSDRSDKIKHVFSNQWLCQYCCMDGQHGCWLSLWRESLTEIAQEWC